MSSSGDLCCVSSLLLHAILVAVVSVDALGFLVNEHRPGDTISASSWSEALFTENGCLSPRRWPMLSTTASITNRATFQPHPSLLSCYLIFLSWTLTTSPCRLWSCLTVWNAPCPPPCWGARLTSYLLLLMHPNCFCSPLACVPVELTLLWQSSVLSHATAAFPAPQPGLGPDTKKTFQLLPSPRW